MLVKRNLCYADRPTFGGKVFTTTCLEDLARELNESANKRNGYTLDVDLTDTRFYATDAHLSHLIHHVSIEGSALVAEIETLATKDGLYLASHLKEYVFRPQATFFETDARFFSIRHFDAIAAIKIGNDYYDSINVLWSEHIATKKQRIICTDDL